MRLHPMATPSNHTNYTLSERLMALIKDDDNILFAILFGSHAERTARKESDLDLAIYFRNPPQGMDKLAVINELSDAAGRDVHLVVLNESSALLRHQVLKYGVPVIIKDMEAYYRFREKTIANYDEYKFVSGMTVYDR